MVPTIRASPGTSLTSLTSSRPCVRAIDKDATCDACARSCPAGAIQLRDGPVLDAEACLGCGVCVRSCPTGAFEGVDAARSLLSCASGVTQRAVLELVCASHPAPVAAEQESDAVVVVRGCLASLGPAAYLGLFALGVRSLRVRLDVCAGCSLSGCVASIDSAISDTQGLVSALGGRQTIRATAAGGRRRNCDVVRAWAPPVSRRGFFGTLGGQSNSIHGLPGHQRLDDAGMTRLPLERRYLLRAFEALVKSGPVTPISVKGFARLEASAACTACDVCSRACPTGALKLDDRDGFRLFFSSARCTDCGLCLQLCAPGALSRRESPTPLDLLDPAPLVLRRGELRRCSRCASSFAGPSDDDLCSSCAMRKTNPFAVLATGRAQDGAVPRPCAVVPNPARVPAPPERASLGPGAVASVSVPRRLPSSGG